LRAVCCAPPDVAADQGARVFRPGRVTTNVSAPENARSARLTRTKAEIGAQRLQMLRWQVAGQLESLVANRANECREAGLRSSLPEAVRHPLLRINRLQAWFRPDPVFLGRTKPSPGVAIAPEIRRLARAILRPALRRHRRPSSLASTPTSTSARPSSCGSDPARRARLIPGSGSTCGG
jgi:putative transposase